MKNGFPQPYIKLLVLNHHKYFYLIVDYLFSITYQNSTPKYSTTHPIQQLVLIGHNVDNLLLILSSLVRFTILKNYFFIFQTVKYSTCAPTVIIYKIK